MRRSLTRRASASRCAASNSRDAAFGEREQRVEFVAAERVAFGGALQFDEAAAVVHHHVHVGVAVAVLGVVEVEHRHAAVDADRNRGDRADDRVLARCRARACSQRTASTSAT